MVPEIGQISLALALCLAVALAVFPLAGAHTGNVRWMEVARPCALGMLAFVALAFAMLAVSFFRHDFSVLYVAQHSNLKLPAMYRFAAIWGAHEGSLVLWQLILSSWTAAVALASRTLPQVLRARVLGVLGLVSIGFLLFILLTSNPFLRLFPAAADGADLNPLLQDPAMAIHPPLLYMGYVGMAVPFAFAIAALLSGAARPSLGSLDPSLDHRGLDVSHGGDRTGELVGLLRAGLGRMVVLGPGGERLVYALAGGHRADSHAGRDGATRAIPATRRCCWRSLLSV